MTAMPYKVAAFYQFASLPDFRDLREPLRALCGSLKLKGSVLLAHEGINGTLAGSVEAIDELVATLRRGDLFGGRLDRLELKFSSATTTPFGRLKVRLKKEIVTFGDKAAEGLAREVLADRRRLGRSPGPFGIVEGLALQSKGCGSIHEFRQHRDTHACSDGKRTALEIAVDDLVIQIHHPHLTGRR